MNLLKSNLIILVHLHGFLVNHTLRTWAPLSSLSFKHFFSKTPWCLLTTISQSSFFTCFTFVWFQSYRVDVIPALMLREHCPELNIRKFFWKFLITATETHAQMFSHTSNKNFSLWLTCYIETEFLKSCLVLFQHFHSKQDLI